MTKGRFLYLSYFLPPLGKAESRHNVAWLRELVELGFTAEVMTASVTEKYPQDPSLNAYLPDGKTKFHRVMKRSEGGKIVRYLRYRAGFIDLVSYSGWEAYLEYALRLHREAPFDFIYSVYGIPLSHKIALEMKEQTGLPWIAEFRDPMVHNLILNKVLEDRCLPFWRERQKRKMHAFEGSVVRSANLVIVEAPRHDEELVREYAVPKSKVLPLGVGYDSRQFSPVVRTRRHPDRLRIGYIGFLYEGFVPLVEMIVAGLAAAHMDGAEFDFVVVGDDRRVFETMSARHGLKNLVHMGRVSQKEALEAMQGLDVGLIMLNDGYNNLINSKLWEYLYARLSILALAPDTGVMAEWIRKHQAGYVLPYSVDGISRELKKLFKDANDGKLKVSKPATIEEYDACNVVPGIARRIHSILDKGGTD